MSAPAGGAQFRFVQLEFPWALGPEDGRYVLRRHAGEDPDHVLVVRTLGAPQRRLLRGRRAKRVGAQPDPEPVATARVTVVDAVPFDGPDAAEAWLKDADGEELAAEAIRMVNRVLHLHRAAVAEGATRDISRDQALAVRIGYGAGEEVAEGRYAAALQLPVPRGPRGRRAAVLRPQERLAALLSGRDAALACEELALRARADLRAGRSREAALSLRPALEAAVAELEPWAEKGDLRERVGELAQLRADAVGLYERALEGGLDDGETGEVDRVLKRLEAALRARTASGLE